MSPTPQFFLGRIFDPAQGKVTDQPLTLDPANLTTHAIVTGMTGSGKTGLCIGLLEEAALQGIPAVIIDPKGDLTNLLLHFPDLLPADFEPWLDPDAARRAGKTIPALADETAATWKNGLAGWGLGHDQLAALRDAVRFTIYTPGSTSGVPVNILSSFAAPNMPWQENAEILREKIATVVTALLSLVGMTDIDPLRSREHILLSNIIEHSWSSGKSIDMTDLILMTQNPPIERLGAFPLDSFFPQKDRFELAMLLNNFLASPSFQTWLEGEPLDIAAMLYTSDGKPRHSIFYLAHLSETERMFFVTLLFASVESWMRGQRGTSGLRALVYMDEIMGYLPPTARPPSHTIMLRLLKQARAFGVGLVFATQNPVDVDYKAISNAGTWFIGRLQTDQDKARLLDGLQNSGGTIDIREIDKLISGLQKRVFVVQSVYRSAPVLFGTRWTMNYLAGPLTRTQIPDLNRLVNATPLPARTQASAPAGPAVSAAAVASYAAPTPAVEPDSVSHDSMDTRQPAPAYTSSRPAVATGISEYFLPNEIGVGQALQTLQITAPTSPDGMLYRPALVAQAEVRFINRRYNLEYTRKVAVLLTSMSSSLVHWDELDFPPVDPDKVSSQPLPGARFTTLPAFLSDPRRVAALQKDFADWVVRTSTIHVRSNEDLKLYANPDLSSSEFRDQCSAAARTGLKAEQDKIEAGFETKIKALQLKIDRQEVIVKQLQDKVNSRKLETAAAGGELLLSLFGGRKRSLSTSISKGRMASETQGDLNQARQLLTDLQKQLEDLTQQQTEAVSAAQDRWAQLVNNVTEVPISPAKKDVYVELFGLAWLPYYLIPKNGQMAEAPAFKSA